jgi:hypothetical protein
MPTAISHRPGPAARQPRRARPYFGHAVGVSAVLALLTACPSQVSSPRPQAEAEAAVGPNDPRVVQDGQDLYPAEAFERVESRRIADEAETESLGTGRPDETNGVCRLYAPKLPNPTCCEVELGFDVETVQRVCGHDIYLGESFQFSCGYYFHSEQVDPPWFRLSVLAVPTVEQAAEAHDAKLRNLVGDAYGGSQPVPGVPGAVWSHHGEHHWAFIPGWSKIRQLAWRNESCTNEGAVALIRQLIGAKQPPEGAERLSLIPKART